MAEEFPIVVAIKPNTTAGEQAVDRSLAQLETHAKDTGDAIGKALGGGFTEAAAKAKETGDVVGDALAKAFDDAAKDATSALRKMAAEEKAWADAAQKAKARIAQENAALAAAFTRLENAMLPAVRAEREYAEAAKLAGDAVKAGIATEEQARAVLTEKAKALEQVTVAQQDAKAGLDAYDRALRQSADVTVPKSSSALREMAMSLQSVVRTVAGIGDMFTKVRMAIDMVTTGFETSKIAALAAIEAWKSMSNSGPSAYVGGGYARGRRLTIVNDAVKAIGERYTSVDTLPQEIADAIADPSIDDQAVAALANARVKRQREALAAIDKASSDFAADVKAGDARRELESRPARLAGYEREDAEITRLMERQIAARQRIVERGGEITRKMLDDEAALDRRAEEFNRRVAADPQVGGDLQVDSRETLAARRDRRIAYAAEQAAISLVAAQEEIERTSPWNELAADIAIVTGQLTEANAAALEWISANEDTYEASPWDDLAGDIATAYSAVLDLTDGLDKAGLKAKDATDGIDMFDAAVTKAAAGAVADLVGELAKMGAEWDFSADALEAWGETALRVISEVILKMAALTLVQQIFGRFGGGNANGFGSLLFQALGGSRPNASAREAPAGDPFGGAGGSNAGAVSFREPVPSGGNGSGGNGGAAPAVQLKVVVVSNERDAARELLEGPEGERVVLAHTAKHRGKLGALGR